MIHDRTEIELSAWEEYRQARLKADLSLSFDDGKAAAMAWKRFADLFAGHLPAAADRRNIATFPIHKTRPPGGV